MIWPWNFAKMCSLISTFKKIKKIFNYDVIRKMMTSSLFCNFLQKNADFSTNFRHYGRVLKKIFFVIVIYSLLAFFWGVNQLIWGSTSKVMAGWILVQFWAKNAKFEPKKCWRHQKYGRYEYFFYVFRNYICCVTCVPKMSFLA